MKLSEWLNEERGRGVSLATAIGISPVLVSQWSTGPRVPPIERCVPIERATEGAVTRQDLRPSDWQDIWPELADAKTAQAQDAISDVAAEAQAAILHVAETAEAEIKQAIEELRHGAPAAEPWDGVSERRHVSAPCTASGQEIAGPPEPVDPALSRAMAEAAQAGLIERRRVLRRAQDKARAGLAYRAAGEEV